MDGLTPNIIKQAFEKCRVARYGILDEIMLKAIDKPRADVSDWAPKMTTMHIHPDKIREVIGKGGSVIQNIVAESGAKVDIEDDGTVTIAAVKAADAEKARKMIEAIVKEPEPGEIYYGKVVRLMNFGAFVNLLPGKDGMVHISKMADHRIEKVEDAVKEGDMVWVKVMEIDDKGRVNLSMKDVKEEEKMIQNIVAESGAKVDIEDDGTVTIAAVKAADAEKARKMIEAIVKEPEPGEIYYGKVVRLMNFGAFVNLLPGKDGMVHISKMADHRIEKVEDAVKEGDMVWVKVMEIDDKGRVNLSMKDVKEEEKIK